MKDIETICFDKTGTITQEIPKVIEIVTRDSEIEQNELLSLAASAEAKSNHPIAQAIIKETRQRNIAFTKPLTKEVILGRGIQAKTQSGVIRIGNQRFIESAGINTSHFFKSAKKHTVSGHTAVFVARDQTLEGMIVMTNTVRSETSAVLKWLRANGIQKTYLISGDSLPAVKSIAENQPFDRFKAELLPEAKARLVEKLENDGHCTMMVGDGVNDALALSKATIGVAMGVGGSEVAIETADVALADSDLRGLLVVRRLSEQTHRIVEMNFWLATASNLAGVILGFTGKFSPLAAGFFHVGHTVGILINSGRLLNWQAPDLKYYPLLNQ